MTQHSPTRRQFIGVTSAVAIAATAGCTTSGSEGSTQEPDDGQNSPEEPTEEPTDTDTETTSTTTTSADVVTVEMHTDNEGFYFDPKGVRVEPGTTVRFLNHSGSHSSTAYHPKNDDKPQRIPTDADPWDTELLTETDKTVDVTFDVEGVYDYYCRPHESMGMVGRIVVGEPQGGPGTTAPDDLPPSARDALPPIDTIVEDGSVAGP